MNLIESMMEKCSIYTETTVADGAGGYVSEWAKGAEFDAVVTIDTSISTAIAQKETLRQNYLVTVRKNVPMKYGNIIKREKEGIYLRITSGETDTVAPSISSLDMRQYKAEKWDLR